MCLCGMCLCGSTTFCRIRMSHTCRMPCYDASGCAHRFGGVFVCTERLDSNESQFEPSSGVCNGIPLHAPLLGGKASGIRSSECDKRFASPSTKVAQRAPFCFSNTKSLPAPLNAYTPKRKALRLPGVRGPRRDYASPAQRGPRRDLIV